MMEELILQHRDKKIYATQFGKSKCGVLLCPPHPAYGGNRKDLRLVVIANKLTSSGISALCIDYSAYTGGIKEVEDVLFALEYMKESMTSIGLLGYSYGAVVASNAATQFSNLKGLVLISPLRKVNGLTIDLSSTCNKLIIYGLRDSFILRDIDQLYASAKGEKQKLSLDTDHFYSGYEDDLASAVLKFFSEVL